MRNVPAVSFNSLPDQTARVRPRVRNLPLAGYDLSTASSAQTFLLISSILAEATHEQHPPKTRESIAAHSPAPLSAIARIVSMNDGARGVKGVWIGRLKDGRGRPKRSRDKVVEGSDFAVINGPASCQQAIGPAVLYPFASADSRAARSSRTCGAIDSPQKLLHAFVHSMVQVNWCEAHYQCRRGW